MNRYILLVSLLAVAGGACHGYKDNPSTCTSDSECASKHCNLATYTCDSVPGDSGTPDSPLGADSGSDLGGNGDAAKDAGKVDAPGTCGADLECAAEAPICSNHVCSKCADDSACAQRAGGAATCDKTTGRCVECASSANCTVDPARPLCVGNLCVGCGGAAAPAAECKAKTAGAAPACNPVSGKCVQCAVDTDCPGAVCNTTTNTCVECNAHADCKTAGKPLCSSLHTCVACGDSTALAGGCSAKTGGSAPACSSAGACVQCTHSADCKGTGVAGPVCDTSQNKCVECLGKSDCAGTPAKAFCVNKVCSDCQAAGAGACTGATPQCATSGTLKGQCVECLESAHCSSAAAGKRFCANNACSGCYALSANPCTGTTPVCAPATNSTKAGECVGCLASSDCADNKKPVCDTASTFTCGICSNDSQCASWKVQAGPGVCMGHQDGRCALDSETLYVNLATCGTGTHDGSAAKPFCGPQDAVSSLSATRKLIVVNGATTNLAGPISTSLGQVSIVGQNDATVTGVGVPGIQLAGGQLYLRRVSVANSTGASGLGIAADGGASLIVDTCQITGNKGGGIKVDGAKFNIVNTTISGNSGVGGVFVNNPIAGGAVLKLVTLSGNKGSGISCSSAIDASSTVLAPTDAQQGTGVGDACGFSPCTAAGPTCGAQ